LLSTIREEPSDLLGRPLSNGLELPALVADLGLPSYQTLTN